MLIQENLISISQVDENEFYERKREQELAKSQNKREVSELRLVQVNKIEIV